MPHAAAHSEFERFHHSLTHAIHGRWDDRTLDGADPRCPDRRVPPAQPRALGSRVLRTRTGSRERSERPFARALPLLLALLLTPRRVLHGARRRSARPGGRRGRDAVAGRPQDRKSTRLNSSHVKISYAVFCLKKKKKKKDTLYIKKKKKKKKDKYK